MASADRNKLIAACAAAIDHNARLTPNARLWLARASLRCDHKGRTTYTPDGYSADTQDTITNGTAAIEQLLALALICHDHDDTGTPCLRMLHYDFDQDHATISGYGPDRGLKRDGLPPMYGRSVHHVITPPTGNLNFTPPTWDQIKP